MIGDDQSLRRGDIELRKLVLLTVEMREVVGAGKIHFGKLIALAVQGRELCIIAYVKFLQRIIIAG